LRLRTNPSGSSSAGLVEARDATHRPLRPMARRSRSGLIRVNVVRRRGT
jgi:hypothetical protein